MHTIGQASALDAHPAERRKANGKLIAWIRAMQHIWTRQRNGRMHAHKNAHTIGARAPSTEGKQTARGQTCPRATDLICALAAVLSSMRRRRARVRGARPNAKAAQRAAREEPPQRHGVRQDRAQACEHAHDARINATMYTALVSYSLHTPNTQNKS